MIFFKVISFALVMKILTLSCAAPAGPAEGRVSHTPKRVSSMPTTTSTSSTSGLRSTTASTNNAPGSDDKDLAAIEGVNTTPEYARGVLNSISEELKKTPFDVTKPPDLTHIWEQLKAYHGCQHGSKTKGAVRALRVGNIGFGRQYTQYGTWYTSPLGWSEVGPHNGALKDYPYWGSDGTSKMEAWDGKNLKEVDATASSGKTLKAEGKASGGETLKVEGKPSGAQTLKVEGKAAGAEPETVKRRKSTGILRHLGI